MSTEDRTADTVNQQTWEWFGISGHFICGAWCRFHLATKVGEYFISTVGEYVHPRHSAGSEQKENEWLRKNWPGEDIGFGRKYETMVFKAGAICSREGCNCGMPELEHGELDFEGYNTRGEATKGHMAMCERWANGKPKEIEE